MSNTHQNKAKEHSKHVVLLSYIYILLHSLYIVLTFCITYFAFLKTYINVYIVYFCYRCCLFYFICTRLVWTHEFSRFEKGEPWLLSSNLVFESSSKCTLHCNKWLVCYCSPRDLIVATDTSAKKYFYMLYKQHSNKKVHHDLTLLSPPRHTKKIVVLNSNIADCAKRGSKIWLCTFSFSSLAFFFFLLDVHKIFGRRRKEKNNDGQQQQQHTPTYYTGDIL